MSPVKPLTLGSRVAPNPVAPEAWSRRLLLGGGLAMGGGLLLGGDVLCSRIHSQRNDTILVAAGRAGLGVSA